MIVPRTRLIVWTALIVLPFTILGILSGGALTFSILMILCFLILIILDATLAYGNLGGIRVTLPGLIRFAKEREGVIPLEITNPARDQRWLRIGLPFPRELYTPEKDLELVVPAETETSRSTWACIPEKRGTYFLDRCYLEGKSLLGFWSTRASHPLETEIRVYPNLFSEQKNIAAIFLNRGIFGLHSQRQVGKGREFEKLREYMPGDSFDDIHWKATAKRGRPITKEFQIERTQEIYVIIDASRLSNRNVAMDQVSRITQDPQRPWVPVTFLERFITAALVMGLAAETQHDNFGVLVFSDKVHRFIRAKNGKSHYGVCRETLYALEPRIVTPDFDEVFTFIRVNLRRRALLVFLTSLDDPLLAEGFLRNLEMICRHHLVLVNMFGQEQVAPLFTHQNIASIDDLYNELSGHLQWQKLRELEKIMQRQGVRFNLLDNEKICAQLVSQYITVKQRQLL